VSIQASGKVVFLAGPSGTQEVTPAGDPTCIPQARFPGDRNFLATTLPCWSLIGRIGQGPSFEVGTAVRLEVTTGGQLYLSMNDEDFTDNSGAWTVTITIQAP
jgi:hypothetical protein